MNKIKLLAAVLLTVFASSSSARLSYAVFHAYYDANDVILGWHYVGCEETTTGGITKNDAYKITERMEDC